MFLFRLVVNPFGKTHGAPSDETRHVGDLGNFKTDSQGNGKGSITDSHIKLIGEHSVLGVRAENSVLEQTNHASILWEDVALLTLLVV